MSRMDTKLSASTTVTAQRRRAWLPPSLLLLVSIALSTSLPAAPPTARLSGPASPLPDLTAADLARLEAGEAVVRMEGAEDEIGEGRAWRILEAPAERLFRAVADWRHYREFFPFVVASEAEVAGEGTMGEGTLGEGTVLSHQRIDLPFPFADRTFTATTARDVEATPDGRVFRVAWNHVPGSGNVTENRGTWTLRELAPGRTLVELRLLSDTGPTVPPSLQRRALAETLPWALDGLRQHVDRCRYDVPIHPTCAEAPPFPRVDGVEEGGAP